MIRRVFKDITTLADGESFGTGRVLAVGCAIALVSLDAFSLMTGGKFDPLGTGTGLAAIITAGCFGSKAEEPK